MKQITNMTMAAFGCVALLSIWGGAGCASSSQKSLAYQECPNGTGACRAQSAGIVAGQVWGSNLGSVVSPLGDAPGERDLQAMTGWGLETKPAGQSQPPFVAQAPTGR